MDIRRGSVDPEQEGINKLLGCGCLISLVLVIVGILIPAAWVLWKAAL